MLREESKFSRILSVVAVSIAVAVVLYVVSIYSYLLFHSLAELFSIAVACGIFMLAWNSRRIAKNDFLLFLGIAYLFVAFLDTLHTLGYEGMGVFENRGHGSNLATQLWIGTRFLESASLLVASYFIRRKFKVGVAFGVYLLVVLVLIGMIFNGIFPTCFAPETGLTTFKKASEYVISAILVVALLSLYRRRSGLDRTVFRLLTISIAVTMASEIAFTFYVSAYGFSNLVGHFLKIASFYFVYRAVVETGLAKPYSLLFKNLKAREESLAKARDELELRVTERTADLARSNEQLLRQMEGRLEAEGARIVSEKKYRRLLEAANDAVVVADAQTGVILEVNKKTEELLGMPSTEITGRHQSELYPQEEAERYRRVFAEHLEKGEATADDVFVKRLDGRLVPVEISASVTTVGDRRVMLGLFRDISERKRSRDELQKNYESQRVLNALLKMSLKNISLEDLLKQAIDLVVSTSWLAVQSKGCIFLTQGNGVLLMKAQSNLSDSIVAACSRIPYGKCLCGKAALTGKLQFSDRLDSRHEITYDGIIPHGHYCIPIHAGDNLLGVMCLYIEEGHHRDPIEEEFLHSVTSALAGIIHRTRVQENLKYAEEQLRQSQKMEALGRLVGGIAHDFNNLLVVIGGRAKRALRKMKPDDPARREIVEITKAEESASSLTSQLLAFGRKQILQPKVLDLNGIVSGLEMMLRRLIGENIVLLTLIEPELGRTQVDPNQIEQVVLNLVINARDAMPDGGKLTIQTSNVVLEEKHPDNYAAPPGQYVMLAVSDTGSGMDQETMSHIFDPFFTTKAPGKGTGLGLSTVYGIVRQSGGDIRIYSRIGKGTTFKIYLPRIEAPLDVYERDTGQVKMSSTGTETILLVEDEDTVRELMSLELRDLGYFVLQASSGSAALKLSEEHDGAIDMVVTDVIMPGLSGPDTFRLLSEKRPGIGVLYCSGYSEQTVLHNSGANDAVAFLKKPFAAEDLGQRVRKVLDALRNRAH